MEVNPVALRKGLHPALREVYGLPGIQQAGPPGNIFPEFRASKILQVQKIGGVQLLSKECAGSVATVKD